MHGYIAELTLAERDEIQLFVLRELRHAIGLFQPFRFSCKDLKPDLQSISDYRFTYFVHRNEPFKKKNHPSKPCRFAIERGGSFTIKMAIKKPTQPKHPARLQDSIVLNVQKNRHHLRDCDFGFQIFRDLSKKQHTATKETSAAVSLHCEDP